MKVLVTGDRGYIGATLVPLLLEKDYEVVGLDTHFFKKELDPPTIKKAYRKMTKDIRDIEEKDLKGIDAIIHLSALSNDPMGEINPHLTEEINFKASVKLAKLAKKIGISRFLFSSSCSIYGIVKSGIVDEKLKVNPLTSYAKSKIDMENVLKKMADDTFCVGLLRNATVYGYSPKFRNDLVVNNFVTTALAYNQIRVMSDGTPWRPLIDVRDLSSIFISFLEAKSEKINGKSINIGFNENNFQVKDLLEEVKRQLPHCDVIYTGEHGKDARSYKVKFDLLHSLFPNLKQKWTLSKSIGDLINHLKNTGFDKKDFESGKYTRIAVLKDLIEKKKVNNNLRKI
jgi:nucleoside-diphosphate-sugar epimerase